MLEESLRVLKEDACMLYAVCSIHVQENERVLASLGEVYTVRDMTRLYPAIQHDGFFHATITKSPICPI